MTRITGLTGDLSRLALIHTRHDSAARQEKVERIKEGVAAGTLSKYDAIAGLRVLEFGGQFTHRAAYAAMDLGSVPQQLRGVLSPARLSRARRSDALQGRLAETIHRWTESGRLSEAEAKRGWKLLGVPPVAVNAPFRFRG